MEEIHKLLACCPPPPHPLRDIVMVALTTGMGRGEILGLKWDDVRLGNRLIILPITKDNSVRVLPINDTLYRTLMEMPEKTGYVFGNGMAGISGISNIPLHRHARRRASRTFGSTTYAIPTPAI